MLLLQVGVHLLVIIEHFCGYGAVTLERKNKEPQSKIDIVHFEEMSSLFNKWSYLMVLLKSAQVLMHVGWVNVDTSGVFECN